MAAMHSECPTTEGDQPSAGDSRLSGQEKYLLGVKLFWKRYTRYSDQWDHDHCSFCNAKFMVEDLPDVLHVGYTSEDRYHWICESCFHDFKDRFQWEVVKPEEDEI
jgi:hypothetical protein